MTIVRKGLIDHSDSLGAAARFGGGDVQWLTAGQRHRALGDVPAAGDRKAQPAGAVPDLAQPARAQQDGRAALHDVLAEEIPRRVATDDAGPRDRGRGHRGPLAALAQPLPPPPDSWAAQAGIRRRDLDHPHGAGRALDAAAGERRRHAPHALLLQGRSVHVAGSRCTARRRSSCAPTRRSSWSTAATRREFLLLQGRPIGEPVAQYGPFVMNTQAEIKQAMRTTGARSSAAGPGPTARRCTGASRSASRAIRTGARKCRLRSSTLPRRRSSARLLQREP